MRLLVLTPRSVLEGGGETSWVRVVGEHARVTVVSEPPRVARLPQHPNVVEHYYPGSGGGSVPYPVKVIVESLVAEHDVVVINDVCLLPYELAQLAMRAAGRLGVGTALVIHEGRSVQCGAWLETLQSVDAVVAFDEAYLERLLPREVGDRVYVLGHPVPVAEGLGEARVYDAVLLVRGRDMPYLEPILVQLKAFVDEGSVAVAGSYGGCVLLNKRWGTRYRCVPPLYPSQLSRVVGMSRKAVLVRLPSGSPGKTLFATQIFEAFNPRTPLIAPRQDFTTRTRLAALAVARFVDKPLADATEIAEAITDEAVERQRDWRERYEDLYRRCNARAWLRGLVRALSQR